MNLGQAVAVCLYEFMRDAPSAKTKPSKPKAATATAPVKPATAGEVERITAVLLDALRVSGYLTSQSSASSEDKVRRLVRRLGLTAEDAKLFLGMMRQIAWKLRSDDGPPAPRS